MKYMGAAGVAIGFLVLSLGATPIASKGVVVDFTCVSGTCLNPALDLSEKFENQLNPNLAEIGAEKFNRYVSNSGANATRGLSVDYADTMFKYVNLAFITGLSVTPTEVIDSVREGKKVGVFAFAPGISFSIGLDMHYVPIPILSDFKFFFNVFYLDAAKYASGGGDINITKLKTFSFGLHLMYPVVKPVSVKSQHLLLWGGVNVSGGIDYLGNEYGFEFPLSQTVGATTTTLRPNLELTSKVFTIPVEVSSNVRFLYVLTLFAGFGADFNFGTSKLYSTATNYTASNGDVYSFSANYGDPMSPHFMSLRVFTGVQINIWALHLATVLNYSFTSKSLGVNVGVRFSI